MSRPDQASLAPARSLTYRALLARPGARPAFAAAAVARLSFGMAGLSLLLLVHQATGSFAAAGAAAGAFSAGTLTAPVKARLMDRRGQRFTLPVLGLGAAAALLAMTALGRVGVREAVPYIIAAATAGALIPPVGAAMRARWAIIAGPGSDRERAYSLDAATEETLFTAGPLLTGLTVTAAGPILPLLITAVLLAAGCVLLAAASAEPVAAAGTSADAGPPTDTPAPTDMTAQADTTAAADTTAPARARLRRGLAGPLAAPGFLTLLAIVLATSLGLGAVDVTITARAVAGHHPGAAGVILAAASLGSAFGGLAWGRRRHHRRASTQMTGLLVIMAAGLTLTAVAPDLVLAGVALALTGTVLAPSAVLSYLCAERLAGPGTEASTWVNTAWNAGVASGLAVTGLAVAETGPTVPLLAGAAVLGAAAVAALARRPIFDTDPLATDPGPAKPAPGSDLAADAGAQPAA